MKGEKFMEKKVALVTGASRGIGKSIAIDLAKNDYIVVINYYSNDKEAKKVLDEVNSYSEGCLFKADVSNVSEVNDMYKKIKEKYNRLDVLVNNAGAIIRPGSWKEISEEDWQRTIDINLKGVFNCIKVFAELLKESENGRIINFTSTVGISAVAPVIAYGAAKAGVINLTNAFAKELAPSITVNAIAPGNIDTDMTTGAGKELVDWVINNTPMKRLGRPEEVAYLVSFLASEKASFITGQIIEVAGGYDLR
jgi:3-oxoacyl-[acyl-carrier protein] reductase